MSRVGNKPITVPQGVEIKIEKNSISVKGPKGEMSQVFDPDIQIELKDQELQVTRPTDQKRHKAMHGLYRALVNNMVEGVSKGFTRKLELVGVGYRVEVMNNDTLDLTLGYSHHVYFKLPPEVKVKAETEKGKNPTITLESHDKQLVGQVASKIKSLRKVEPYKGKGIRFVGEYIRRKAGKTAAK